MTRADTIGHWRGVARRAGGRFLEHNSMLLASALAYSTFFAIPSALLVAFGLFTLVAGPGTLTALVEHVATFAPRQVVSLLDESLHRLDRHPDSGVLMTVLGLVLALWSTTGAAGAYMTALDLAVGRRDERGFLRKRLAALRLVGVLLCATVLVGGLLVFGPFVERFVARCVGPAGSAVGWIWWSAEWPILLLGLLVAFAALRRFSSPGDPAGWRLVTPGSLVASLGWIAASGLFALYTATFGSYDKTWGSLAAVIVTLTWLWLAAATLLLGAEVDAEAERSRGAPGAVVSAPFAGRRARQQPARRAGSEAGKR